MSFERLRAVIIVVAVIAALLVATVFLIRYALDHEDRQQQPVSPAAEAPQLPVGSGQYVAQPGDSCSGIARDVYCRAGDEKDVKAFLEVNSFLVSQESLRRGVQYTDCPILAGQTYKVPDGWVRCKVPSGVSSEVASQAPAQTQIVLKSGSIWDYWQPIVGMLVAVIALEQLVLVRFRRWLWSKVNNPFRWIPRPRWS